MSKIIFQFFLKSQGITPNTKAVIDCCIKVHDKINCEKHTLKSNNVLKKLYNLFQELVIQLKQANLKKTKFAFQFY